MVPLISKVGWSIRQRFLTENPAEPRSRDARCRAVMLAFIRYLNRVLVIGRWSVTSSEMLFSRPRR